MNEQIRLSKRLSLVLRHDPASAGLTLDEGGWVDVTDVLAALYVSREDLDTVVRTSDKQRFAIVDERIRAQQGHSVPVDLGLGVSTPPAVLWHGTPERSVPAILVEGLTKQRRHAVHLSPDPATAERVGARRGRPVLLRVDAAGMAADGFAFSVSGNGVWLVDRVPATYLLVSTHPKG